MVTEKKLPKLLHYPITIALLLLGCISFAYAGFSLFTQGQLPSDGVLLTEFSAKGLSVSVVLNPNTEALRVGDEILSIAGHSIWEWAEHALQDGTHPLSDPPASNWQVGDTLLYRVRRDGTELELPITLAQFPAQKLPLLRFGVYILALTGLVVSSYMLIKQPESQPGQLFFIAGLGLTMPLMLHFQTMTLVTPTLFMIDNGIKFFSRALLSSCLLHAFLIFPVEKVKTNTLKKYAWVLHLLNPLLSLSLSMLLGDTWLQKYMIAFQATSWITMLMLSGAIASVLHTYISEHGLAVQGQIRWVAWGTLLSLVPYMVFTAIPEALNGQAWFAIEITSFFITILPISIAVAIARYRLFDIDAMLWNTLFYVIFISVAIGTYLVFHKIIAALIFTLSGSVNSNITIFVSTLIVVSGFWLLRIPLSRYANHFLFRIRSSPQKLLEETTEKLVSAIRLDQLSVLLAEDIPYQLGASRGGLMVLSEDKTCLEFISGPKFCLPLNGLLSGWMEHTEEVLLRSLPQSWITKEALQLMDERNVELLTALRVGDQMVGLWSLGPREGSLSYTSADIHLIETIGRQAALAVQNARLVRSLENNQQQLEAEVLHRTQAMSNDRNRLNAILQNMADALLVTDGKERILMANPAFENLVRRSLNALLGRNVEQVLPLPELAQAIRQALNIRGIIHTATMKLIDSSLNSFSDIVLTERILRASVTALGDSSAVICVLRDVTRDVEVDRMKSEFISAVSHELRTPLTSILGFAKLTHRTFERTIFPVLPNSKKVQRAAARIDRNLDIMVLEGQRLTDLINDVLDIAALDAGTLQWNEQPYDLSNLLEQAICSLEVEAAQKGLEIKINVQHKLPLMKADPERIEQVLFNLISNAIKFTEQGSVSINIKCLSPEQMINDWKTPNVGAVHISVTDTGMGIPPEEIARLFNRFNQGGDTILDKPSGTGLGLAIAQEIIAHYGGNIWVDSQRGKGSTFHFTLPTSTICQTQSLPQPIKAPAPPQGQQDTRPFILVVDNDPHTQDLLCDKIDEKATYRVLVIKDSAELLEQARQQKPALILLDLQTAQGKEKEILQQLKADASTAQIPVIALSTPNDAERDRTPQDIECLSKPLDQHNLHNVIAKLINYTEI